MPEITKLEGGEWLINGDPRQKVSEDCQLILTSPDACQGCPLATLPPEEPPSPWLRHVVALSQLQDCGAMFHVDDLTPDEWQSLALLKAKRNEKQFKELKRK